MVTWWEELCGKDGGLLWKFHLHQENLWTLRYETSSKVQDNSEIRKGGPNPSTVSSIFLRSGQLKGKLENKYLPYWVKNNSIYWENTWTLHVYYVLVCHITGLHLTQPVWLFFIKLLLNYIFVLQGNHWCIKTSSGLAVHFNILSLKDEGALNCFQ